MQIETAKLLLSTFRPSGADADAPSFQEALALVKRDADLAAWFARERNQDLAFARLLTSQIQIPTNLKSQIIEGVLQVKSPTNEEPSLINFEDIPVPKDLRSKILTNFETQQVLHQKVIPLHNRWHKNWQHLTAIAAILIIALTLAISTSLNQKRNSRQPIANANQNKVSQPVEQDQFFLAAVRALENSQSYLYMEVTDHSAYQEWLQKFGYAQLPEDTKDSLYNSQPLGVYMVELNGSLTAIFKAKQYNGKTVYLLALIF